MNVPTMTIGQTEQDSELMKLRKENEELKARLQAYEEDLRIAQRNEEHSYLRGRIDGLEFSIRCNGISGDEVKR